MGGSPIPSYASSPEAEGIIGNRSMSRILMGFITLARFCSNKDGEPVAAENLYASFFSFMPIYGGRCD